VFFGVTSKKWSSLVFLHTLGAIFAQIFKDFAQTFKLFFRIFKDFAQNFKDFAQIFRDFAQIFNKSKLFGGVLAPPPPTPL